MNNAQLDQFIKSWNRIHNQTARVMGAAPDDKLDWRPAEGMFALRELICHFPQAELLIVRSALAGSAQKSELDLSGLNVSQIVETFNHQHDRLAEEVSRLSADQLKEEVDFFGRKMPRLALLIGMTEHEIHHRGQLFVYLRLLGVKPPSLYG
jgi:uncharacterized damage-inducible protein DinB